MVNRAAVADKFHDWDTISATGRCFLNLNFGYLAGCRLQALWL